MGRHSTLISKNQLLLSRSSTNNITDSDVTFEKTFYYEVATIIRHLEIIGFLGKRAL